jgi:hypothetical protein
MGDDWRVQVEIEDHSGVRERRVAQDARERLGSATRISVDPGCLFAYADTEAQAREAEEVLRELTAAHALHARTTVARWHPEEERWEPPDVAPPATAAEQEAERRTREADEAAESRERGLAEWEVRIEMPNANASEALADRLHAEGMSVVRRSRHVVVAAASEDDASALAERISALAPEARSVTSEGSAAAAMDDLSPFAALRKLLRRR